MRTVASEVSGARGSAVAHAGVPAVARLPRPAAIVAALPALLLARAAIAAPPPVVRLSLVRAEGADTCADVVALEAAVSDRLGRNPFAADASRDIEVVVSREPRRWTAGVFVREGTGALVGTRRLESNEESCAAILEPTALAIALSIDPEAALRSPTAVPRPPAPPLPPAPPPAPSPPPVAPAPSPVHGAQEAIRVTGRFLTAFGLLPSVAPGFALAAEGRLAPRFTLAGAVEVFPETRTADGAFGFGQSDALVAGCALPVASPHFELALCADARGGVIHAVVYTLEPTTPGDRPWLAVGGSGEVRFCLLSWLFTASASALAPLAWYRFRIETRPPSEWVFRQGQPSGMASVGFGRRF
jgi:hypothetical protein